MGQVGQLFFDKFSIIMRINIHIHALAAATRASFTPSPEPCKSTITTYYM